MPMVPRDFTRNVSALMPEIIADVYDFLGIEGVPVTFTQQPTVTPLTGTAGEVTFTATSGVLSDGSTPTRAYLQGTTALSTVLTFSPDVSVTGDVVYQEYGPDGALSVPITVTVNAAGGTPTPAPTTTNTLIANRAQPGMLATSITAPTTTRRVQYADSHGDVTNIRTVDLGWFYSSGSVGETNVGNDYSIKRSIEYPAGVFHPVTWSGASGVTVPNGGQSISDVVMSSVTGGPLVIPAGAMFFERTGATATSVMPLIEQPASSVALGIPDGNSSTDQVNSGTIAATTSVNRLGCAAMIGDIAADDVRTFVIGGDSITSIGQGDITSVGARGSSGYLGRYMDRLGYSCVRLGRGGIYAQAFASNNSRMSAFLNTFSATDFILQAGINDVTNSRSAAQIANDFNTILTLPAVAGKVRHQCTLTPRAASTDAYATTANQTPRTDGNMSSLPAINDAIRAQPSYITGQIFDAADLAMTARNSGIWKAPPQPTTDGTHPTSGMAAMIAAGLPTTITGA